MVRAYRRRWARLAWHVAALSRMTELPELDDLTGEIAERPAQTAQAMMHNIRLWRAALPARGDGKAN